MGEANKSISGIICWLVRRDVGESPNYKLTLRSALGGIPTPPLSPIMLLDVGTKFVGPGFARSALLRTNARDPWLGLGSGRGELV